MFQVFIQTIIDFCKNPLESNENLYSRKQLYYIIFPTLALIVFLIKTILLLILEKIFGVDFVASQYYYSDLFLGNLDYLFWLIFPIKQAIKESFIFFFLLSTNPRNFFIGAVFLLCFPLVELGINSSQEFNTELSWYVFRYLMLASICIGSYTLFEKKLRRLFRKITPYFTKVIIVSCLFYWLYSSIQFDPNQTPLLAILILNLRFSLVGLIFSWVRIRYSFRELLLFSILMNISYYAGILVIICNLFNIVRYRKEIIGNHLIDFRAFFK
ncbi:MAG: hypothetical protein AAGA80_25055 [Cyanobacteria bacterium P01_F01_bin.143]